MPQDSHPSQQSPAVVNPRWLQFFRQIRAAARDLRDQQTQAAAPATTPPAKKI